MTVRFRKITEDRIDLERVTLRILDENGTLLGRVSTLAYGESGAIEEMSTEGADPPIATALELAAKLAAFKEQDVDVVDPDGLWRAEWGALEG